MQWNLMFPFIWNVSLCVSKMPRSNLMLAFIVYFCFLSYQSYRFCFHFGDGVLGAQSFSCISLSLSLSVSHKQSSDSLRIIKSIKMYRIMQLRFVCHIFYLIFTENSIRLFRFFIFYFQCSFVCVVSFAKKYTHTRSK